MRWEVNSSPHLLKHKKLDPKKRKRTMFDRFNERLKKLNVIDMGLVKWTVLFAAIILVKLFPQLLNLSYPVLIILMIVCAIKPCYKFWVKK